MGGGGLLTYTLHHTIGLMTARSGEPLAPKTLVWAILVRAWCGVTPVRDKTWTPRHGRGVTAHGRSAIGFLTPTDSSRGVHLPSWALQTLQTTTRISSYLLWPRGWAIAVFGLVWTCSHKGGCGCDQAVERRTHGGLRGGWKTPNQTSSIHSKT